MKFFFLTSFSRSFMASDPGSNQATEKTDNNDEGLSSTFRTTVIVFSFFPHRPFPSEFHFHSQFLF